MALTRVAFKVFFAELRCTLRRALQAQSSAFEREEMTAESEQKVVDAQYAEIQGATRAAWRRLPEKRRASAMLILEFVKRIEGARLHFHEPLPVREVGTRIAGLLNDMVGSSEITFGTSAQLLARRSADRLQALIDEPEKFARLDFGVDVAERDVDLLKYFITRPLHAWTPVRPLS